MRFFQTVGLEANGLEKKPLIDYFLWRNHFSKSSCLESIDVVKNFLAQIIHFQQTLYTPFGILCVKRVIDII